MEKYGLNQLREMFLSFFETKDHLRLPSFSLIPKNDASLLLINSGMAPMKPWFTGEQEPPRRRVCTCQKCIRTGDIENIGHTDRHGTYFEMLGNFSFGDYFKTEAIAWCWEFLTSPQWVGLDPARLYPSVYLEDDEAFGIWEKDIGISPERIFRFGKADNFWEHGVGPCGPCSEVYFDRGEQYGCGKEGCTVGCDCDRYIEVWNNVFTQFYNDGNGNYTELSQKNIDTGMGLERLAVVCQGVGSLFEVDTVMRITEKVSELTGAVYGKNRATNVSLRVITDHIRSATFMIGDGVLPSNEGRGYVLRRLLRRAARHGKMLGRNEPFLFEVCATVIGENENHYSDLTEKRDYITRVIRVEEENFAKTIDAGMKILAERVEDHKKRGETVFAGADAFKLYDTYGFPIDLTIEIVDEQGMSVDRAGFNALMDEQRDRARAARAALGDLAWAGIELGLDNTPTVFTGYDRLDDTGKILAIVTDGETCSTIREGEKGIIVLDKTPFYAEMGGQATDYGVLVTDGGSFTVTDVQKNKGDKYLHYGQMTKGTFSVDESVTAQVDVERRRAIMRAHSATHMVHKALRRVLGDHVQQAGSLVEPDRMRFDFTHFSAMTPEEISQVEHIVNEAIMEGYIIKITEMSVDEAKSLGAMALFDEKYGDTVRVVDMGGFSRELCGGTHLDNTAKAGPFIIEAEFSVASGVRRIEATTGSASLETLRRSRRMLFQAAERMKSKPAELLTKIDHSLTELRELRGNLEKFKSKELLGNAEQFLTSAKRFDGLRVITAALPGADVEAMRKIGDFLRDKAPNIVAVLASVKDEKISFLAVCGPEAVAAGIRAGDLVKAVSAICGGKGGGKPDSAMGGGSDLLKLDDALAHVDDFVANNIKK